MAIQTVRDLYNSMEDNVAYATLGKWYYKWGKQNVPEDEQHLCTTIDEKLSDLGYKLVDSETSGEYNDIRGYMGAAIEEE